MRNPEIKEQKKREIMEKCYDCYCEYGLNQTGMKALAKACGMTPANLYVYFDNLDQLILESTAYCMAKVEDDFMEWAPQEPGDVEEFLDAALLSVIGAVMRLMPSIDEKSSGLRLSYEG